MITFYGQENSQEHEKLSIDQQRYGITIALFPGPLMDNMRHESEELMKTKSWGRSESKDLYVNWANFKNRSVKWHELIYFS